MENKNPKDFIGKLCFAWYPINKKEGTNIDLYFALPLSFNEEYFTCILFYGNELDRLIYRCKADDVCIQDVGEINLDSL